MSKPVTPLVAADLIIRLEDVPGQIVLIERLNPPYGWALPGGFVDCGESVEMAAIREAAEEVGLYVELEYLLGCYSDPERDSRGHTVSLVYIARASGRPKAADDAKSVRLVDPQSPGVELAFDHGQILNDYLAWLENGSVAPLRA